MNVLPIMYEVIPEALTVAERAHLIRDMLSGFPEHSFVDMFRYNLRLLFPRSTLPRTKSAAFYDHLLTLPLDHWTFVLAAEVQKEGQNVGAFYKFDRPLNAFLCPITHELPVVPTGTPGGHIYDSVGLEEWIEENHTDPMTRAPLFIHDLRRFSIVVVNQLFNDRPPSNKEERDLQTTWRAARGQYFFEKKEFYEGALVHHAACLRLSLGWIRDDLAMSWYTPLTCCSRVKACAICEVARWIPEFHADALECMGIFAAQRLETLFQGCAYFDELDKPELKFKALAHFFNLDQENTQVRDQLVHVAVLLIENYDLDMLVGEVAIVRGSAYKLVVECAFEGKWGVAQNYERSRGLLEYLARRDELTNASLWCRLAFMYIKGLGGPICRARGYQILEGVRSEESARMLRDFDQGASAVQWTSVNPAKTRAQEQSRAAEKRREELIPPPPAPRRQRVDSVEILDTFEM